MAVDGQDPLQVEDSRSPLTPLIGCEDYSRIKKLKTRPSSNLKLLTRLSHVLLQDCSWLAHRSDSALEEAAAMGSLGFVLPPEPLIATIAAAKQAMSKVEEQPEDIKHMPSMEDIRVLLPAAQHAAIGGGSVYEEEAEEAMTALRERLGLKSYDKYQRVGIIVASLFYSTSISAEALTCVGNLQGLNFLVDDICFDMEDVPSYQVAVGDHRPSTRSVSRVKPARVQEFLARSWIGLLRSLDPPPDQDDHVYGPLEAMVWETGRELRRLSSGPGADPAWLEYFLRTVEDWTAASAAWRARPEEHLRDVHSYTLSRARNIGAFFSVTLLELSNGCFLTPEVRVHPSIVKLNWTASLHIALVNDLFSLARDERSPYPDREYNHIRLLMRLEGMSVTQAVRRVVEVINSYADAFTALEAELLPELERQPNVRRYVLALKELVSGNLVFHNSVPDRYSWPSEAE